MKFQGNDSRAAVLHCRKGFSFALSFSSLLLSNRKKTNLHRATAGHIAVSNVLQKAASPYIQCPASHSFSYSPLGRCSLAPSSFSFSPVLTNSLRRLCTRVHACVCVYIYMYIYVLEKKARREIRSFLSLLADCLRR